jgi:cytosine/adenosine deaminase-related metal-dependent hydrolase
VAVRTFLFSFLLLAVMFVCSGAFASGTANYSIQGNITDVETGELRAGLIHVENGIIKNVYLGAQEIPSTVPAPAIKGVTIYPGLIDNHNHIKYNFMPLWNPSRKEFQNRNEWPELKDYTKGVKKIYKDLYSDPVECRSLPKKTAARDACVNAYQCELIVYAELKALAGGVTSIQGSTSVSKSTADITYQGVTKYTKDAWQTPLEAALTSCLEGGARIIERDAFGGENQVRTTAIGITDKAFKTPEEHKKGGDGASVLAAEMDAGETRAFYIHLSEGIDQLSLLEFDELKRLGLLRKETVIIHGTALGTEQFEQMGRAQMSLVWSPVSNFLLYGRTTNISAASSAGINIALGSDWSLSGTKNLLGELKIVRASLARQNGGEENAAQRASILRMATINGAKAFGKSGFVGAIKPGMAADLLLLKTRKGQSAEAAAALLDAAESDVELVVVGGKPLYGSPSHLKKFAPKGVRLSHVPASECGSKKAFLLDYGKSVNYKKLTKKISSRMKASFERLPEEMQNTLSTAFTKADSLCAFSDERFADMVSPALLK